MSDQKTNPQTLGPTTGAFIKYEATQLTRVAVGAAKGTKAGAFVDYPLREGKKLLALTDEQDGKVVVQPHNCIVNLAANFIKLAFFNFESVSLNPFTTIFFCPNFPYFSCSVFFNGFITN